METQVDNVHIFQPIASELSMTDRVYRYLLEVINEGVFAAGQQLPSENHLAESLKVSRVTLRSALQKLELEGYIKRKRGIGTFIADSGPHTIEAGFEILTSFTYHILSTGGLPGLKHFSIETEVPDERVAKALNLPNNELVSVLYRLRTVDDEPVQWSHIRLPQKYLPPSTSAEEMGHSLYEFLERKYGLIITRTEATISADITDETLANLFSIPIGKPTLRVEQVHFNWEGQPILHSIAYYPQESSSITVQRNRKHR